MTLLLSNAQLWHPERYAQIYNAGTAFISTIECVTLPDTLKSLSFSTILHKMQT